MERLHMDHGSTFILEPEQDIEFDYYGVYIEDSSYYYIIIDDLYFFVNDPYFPIEFKAEIEDITIELEGRQTILVQDAYLFLKKVIHSAKYKDRADLRAITNTLFELSKLEA